MNSTIVSILPVVQRYFTGLLLILLFIGMGANFIVVLIFNRAKHRHNACSIFCSATSASDILILLQGIVASCLTLIRSEDPENLNLAYCKTRLYLRHASVMSNRTFTILSCAACFALTSKRLCLRQWIRQRIFCYRMILFSVIFWFIACSHIFFFTNLIDGECLMIENYSLIFAIYLFIIAGTLSPLLMVIFSGLVLKNLKQLRSRVQPTATPIHLRRRDLQLIRMLLIHIAIYLITTVLYPVDLLYVALTSSVEKSEDRQAIEALISFFTNDFIFYLNNVAPFFTYYFTSSSFRAEVTSLRVKFRVRQAIGQVFAYSSQMIETLELQHR